MIPLGLLRLGWPFALAAAAWLHGCSAGKSMERSAHQEAVIAEAERQGEIARLRARANEGATNVYVNAAKRAASADAAGRTELERLRHTLGGVEQRARDAETACAADAKRIAVLAGLLAESAGLSQEGQRRVESLDAKLSGLQAYTDGVCLRGATPRD